MNTRFEKILKSILEIDQYYKEILQNQLYNQYIYNTTINELQLKIIKQLAEYFGPQKVLNNTGVFNVLNYSSKSEFVIFSYKSFKGTIPASLEGVNSNSPRIKRRRLNLFIKGKLWSNSEYKFGENFYAYLDFINSASEETPINFFCNYAVKKRISRFVLVYGTKKLNIEIAQVNLLDKEQLAGFGIKKLDKLLNLLAEFLEDSEKGEKIPHSDEDRYNRKLRQIKTLLSETYLDVKTEKLFKQCFESFKKTFQITPGDYKNSHSDFEEDFYRALIIYQFNDLPFNLFLFIPQTLSISEDLTVLMIAIAPHKEFPKEKLAECQQLIDNTGKISTYERELFEKLKELIESYEKWRNYYQAIIAKYRRITKAMETLCEAICENNKIKVVQISSRVKEFRSFYNKLFKGANNIEERSDCKFGRIEPKKICESLDVTYKDAIELPEDYYKLVLENIRDIAGVRIVCVYDDDVWASEEIFKELDKKGDLKCSHYKHYTQNRNSPEDTDNFNYRSFHVTVKPGDKRKDLVEYKDMEDIMCEIQVRSVLAHGWSDVEHQLNYKNDMPLKSLDQDTFEKVQVSLGELS